MSAGVPVALVVVPVLVGPGLGRMLFRLNGVTEERAQELAPGIAGTRSGTRVPVFPLAEETRRL